MKKVLSIVLVCIMVFSLAACGADFEGEWKGVRLEGEEAEAMGEFATELAKKSSISINDDGTATIVMMGEAEAECEWEADGDKITFTANGESLNGEMVDDELVLDFDDGKLVFERE